MNARQILVTVVALLALGGAAIGIYALGGEDDPNAVTAAISTGEPALTATQVPVTPTEAPPSPTPLSVASSQTLPDRDSCDKINGTPYRSDSERDFFLENCTENTAPAVIDPAADPPSVGIDGSQDCGEGVEIVTSRSDQTYDVIGLNLDEIADSLDANAPQIEGSTAYGLTEYSYGLDGSYCAESDGSCSLGAVTIAADVTVTLPNLTTLSQISGETLDIWTFYEEQVAIHENRHVRILEEGLEEIKRQLLALDGRSDCAQLDHEIDKVWTFGGGQIEQRQRAFHAADSQGRGGLVVQ